MYVSFRSRSEALRIFNILVARNLSVTLINTPRGSCRSCGLSIIIPTGTRDLVSKIIANQKMKSFYGFFE
ncbi:MAG: DUF3343 domain-containing protein [Christensenellaceae bacterium]|nr:DUF3343 domain-containing protein [Christensenellaceae bacterium]